MRLKRLKKSRSLFQKLQLWKQPKTFPWKRLVLGGGIFGITVVSLYTIFALPDVRDADQLSFAESTIIFARGALEPAEDPNDHVLYTIHGDENREYIPLDEISPWVRKATLAIRMINFILILGLILGELQKEPSIILPDLGMREEDQPLLSNLLKTLSLIVIGV